MSKEEEILFVLILQNSLLLMMTVAKLWIFRSLGIGSRLYFSLQNSLCSLENGTSLMQLKPDEKGYIVTMRSVFDYSQKEL